MSNLPIVLIEVVLIFGGVLAFGIWQLRSLERDDTKDKNDKDKNGNDGA